MINLFGVNIVDESLPNIIEKIESYKGFSFVVTPNIQHLVALDKDTEIQKYYAEARLTLCDSRIVQLLASILNKKIRNVIPGSELTKYYFESFFSGGEKIMVIGSSSDDIALLKSQYNLKNLHHYNPPMGFINDKNEVGKTISEITAVEPRYLFLALGFPRQEVIAAKLKANVNFDCTALCIGASIDFLTGKQRRAPQIWQDLRLEWLYRFFQEPKRLFRRYFIDSWRLISVFMKELRKKDD